MGEGTFMPSSNAHERGMDKKIWHLSPLIRMGNDPLRI
jgi:hypothetical protein